MATVRFSSVLLTCVQKRICHVASPVARFDHVRHRGLQLLSIHVWNELNHENRGTSEPLPMALPRVNPQVTSRIASLVHVS